VERKGVEPSTFALRTRPPTDTSEADKALTATASAACTAACTRKRETDNGTTENGAGDQSENDAEPAADQGGDSLAMLAAALVNLSTADRAKLAAMLLAGDADKAK
jgi:hypothetical protein